MAATKTIRFDDDAAGRARYEVCLMGMFLQGNRQSEKSLEHKRREGRILDALEALGVRPSELAVAEFRELTPGGGVIVFEGPEFDMLCGYVGAAPFPASALPALPSARQAMQVYDWLAAMSFDPESR